MAFQTTYAERQAEAVAGMPATTRVKDSITRSAEGTIGFGVAVSRGATDAGKGVKIGGDIDSFLGVSIRDVTLPISQADSYVQYNNVGVYMSGDIWVQVTGTPGPDDPVHFNATTGVFAASGGTGPVLGARWVRTAANGLGLLSLPFYGQAT